ncbi:MAG: hypothetical protein K6G83_11330, partial [Lachnospiraceae bacterium]|nr:hypothetical protein [Lachnospiraceae bacterium]
VLNLNLMHIEKCEEGISTYQAYGETYEQPAIIVHARPFKRSQCLCPVYILSSSTKAAVAAQKAEQAYYDAINELAVMPRLGRPSKRKIVIG